MNQVESDTGKPPEADNNAGSEDFLEVPPPTSPTVSVGHSCDLALVLEEGETPNLEEWAKEGEKE